MKPETKIVENMKPSVEKIKTVVIAKPGFFLGSIDQDRSFCFSILEGRLVLRSS
jgi:hypothetical protein